MSRYGINQTVAWGGKMMEKKTYKSKKKAKKKCKKIEGKFADSWTWFTVIKIKES